jgi:hypothetical protein
MLSSCTKLLTYCYSNHKFIWISTNIFYSLVFITFDNINLFSSSYLSSLWWLFIFTLSTICSFFLRKLGQCESIVHLNLVYFYWLFRSIFMEIIIKSSNEKKMSYTFQIIKVPVKNILVNFIDNKIPFSSWLDHC